MNTLEQCQTLTDLFNRCVRLYGQKEGFRYFDHHQQQWLSVSWAEFDRLVLRWRRAFAQQGLKRGDRVSMLLVNCLDAIAFDTAALANALVPVPLHSIDTPENSSYILSDSGCKFLVTSARARWNALVNASENDLSGIEQVVFTGDDEEGMTGNTPYTSLSRWLEKGEALTGQLPQGPTPDDLAAIVYTSGTTGRPKGVMLTHQAIVYNTKDTAAVLGATDQDVFLSFLPLSHTFERTATLYSSMLTGASMAMSRGAMMILDDLQEVKPTMFCTVPRVLEQIYVKLTGSVIKQGESSLTQLRNTVAQGWRDFCSANDLPLEQNGLPALDEVYRALYAPQYRQWVQEIFGGRVHDIICGGAALNQTVGKFFCALGVNIRQGYGLTEHCPIISISRATGNHLATVGEPVAHCQVRLGENDELQVFGPSMMKGYLNKPKETREAFTADGWLRTGDQADLSDGGRIRITGRIKEIIVTSTGEKISPVDLEFAIQEDPLFEQVMAVGESRPFITALAVVNEAQFAALCAELHLDPKDPEIALNRNVRARVVKRIRNAARHFPQYGVPRNVYVLHEHWTSENGLLTSTMKMRRRQILQRFAQEIETLYETANKR